MTDNDTALDFVERQIEMLELAVQRLWERLRAVPQDRYACKSAINELEDQLEVLRSRRNALIASSLTIAGPTSQERSDLARAAAELEALNTQQATIAAILGLAARAAKGLAS